MFEEIYCHSDFIEEPPVRSDMKYLQRIKQYQSMDGWIDGWMGIGR